MKDGTIAYNFRQLFGLTDNLEQRLNNIPDDTKKRLEKLEAEMLVVLESQKDVIETTNEMWEARYALLGATQNRWWRKCFAYLAGISPKNVSREHDKIRVERERVRLAGKAAAAQQPDEPDTVTSGYVHVEEPKQNEDTSNTCQPENPLQTADAAPIADKD